MIVSRYYILWQIKNAALNLLDCTRSDIYNVEYFIQLITYYQSSSITFEMKQFYFL